MIEFQLLVCIWRKWLASNRDATVVVARCGQINAIDF